MKTFKKIQLIFNYMALKISRHKILKQKNIKSLDDYYIFVEKLNNDDKLNMYLVSTYGMTTLLCLIAIILLFILK